MDWFRIISTIISFGGQNKPSSAQPIQPKEAEPKVIQQPTQQPTQQGIDWSNPSHKVSKYFTVKEMLYLPSWSRMANESDGLDDQIKNNLIDLANAMDVVREFFGKPINVHVTYRPTAYNKAIGGALRSAHSEGKACDFDVAGLSCDEARKQINDAGMLEKWQMRMEDISALTSRGWVHLDRRQPPAGGHRYFKP